MSARAIGALRLAPTTERRLQLAAGGGYQRIEATAGEAPVPRADLGGDPAALGGEGATVLLRLLHLTDLHVMDAASPARAEWIEARAADPKWRPLLHMARTYDTLANWGVAAHAAASATNGGDLADLAIATGDLIDNAQANELDAFLSLLDGGTFALPYDGPQRAAWAAEPGASDLLDAEGRWPFWLPDGGRLDVFRDLHGFPTLPGLLDAAGGRCTSPGLGLPWLGVLGNHDVMRQGTVFSTPPLEAIATAGWRAFSPGASFDPADPSAAYLDDPAAFSAGLHGRTLAADPGRRALSKAAVLATFRARGGHGFDLAADGSADYVHDTEHVRLIVLDTNHPAGHYQGSIGQAQLDWLDERLAEASPRPVLVVTHHGQVAMDNTYGNEPGTDRRLGDAFAAVLHRHDNVVAWVVGHRHVHRIRAAHDPAGRGRGFWEITTSSTIDWPCQARVIEVVRGVDGSVGIRTTVVDHDALDTSPDADPLVRLAALHREVAANSGRVLGERHREGEPGDRNAVLALPAR